MSDTDPRTPGEAERLFAAARREELLTALRRRRPLIATDQSAALILHHRLRGPEALRANHPGPFLLGRIPGVLPRAISLPEVTSRAPMRTREASFLVELSVKRTADPSRVFTIGRSATCDLVLDLNQVSKLHTYLGRIDEQWLIADADSSNGTFIDGLRLEANQQYPIDESVRLNISTGIEVYFIEVDTLLGAISEVEAEETRGRDPREGAGA